MDLEKIIEELQRQKAERDELQRRLRDGHADLRRERDAARSLLSDADKALASIINTATDLQEKVRAHRAACSQSGFKVTAPRARSANFAKWAALLLADSQPGDLWTAKERALAAGRKFMPGVMLKYLVDDGYAERVAAGTYRTLRQLDQVAPTSPAKTSANARPGTGAEDAGDTEDACAGEHDQPGRGAFEDIFGDPDDVEAGVVVS